MGSERNHRFAVAQLGARMHYSVPRILHRAGRLERLYTDLVATQGWPRWLSAAIPDRLAGDALRRLKARVPRDVPPGKIVTFPTLGIASWLRQRRARSATELTAAYLWSAKEFCRRIVRCGLRRAGAVYAFNGAALELLRFAKERGLATVVEQTAPPWSIVQRWIEEERRAWPGWEAQTGGDALADEFTERERQEWQCADVVLCGSDFVVSGLAAAGGPVERCRVVPYGVDARPHLRPCRRNGRLRVLFSGQVGLRKGVPYLLEAARRLAADRYEFRLVGPVCLSAAARAEVSARAQLTGSVPRAEMERHYAWADVFLLPTICEGSATVCYEALAAGLPVITTAHAGSVVRDGQEGWIVPIRDPEAIAERLELLRSQPELLAHMSQNARLRAGEFTVEKYGERLLAALPG